MSQSVPKDPALRWEWIKYQLRKAGTSLAALARAEQVSRNAMNNVKRDRYPRMERVIAKAIGISHTEIWPERWADEDEPVRNRPNRAENNADYRGKDNSGRVLAHVRNDRAEA